MDAALDLKDPTPVGKNPKKRKPVLKHLIANIQRAMGDRGTNANDTSIAAGLSASFISQLCSGKSQNPSIGPLQCIADALGVSVASLLEEPLAQSGNLGRRPLPYKPMQIAVIGMAETAAYRMTSDLVQRLIEGPPSQKFPHAQPFALEIRDMAMDAAKPPLPIGYDALCIDMRAENLIVESGYIYAIRRARDRGARRPRIDETIIRRAQVFADRVELTAETHFKGAGKFETIIVPGKLTTDPEANIYAFGLVYGAVALQYQI